MSNPPVDFFNQEMAERYDERNRALAPISDNLHFLIRMVLEHLPARAKVLSVGAGTGVDILALAPIFPEWRFVAVEPSLSMLNVCRKKIESAGFADRCEFVHGFASDVAESPEFDAVLAVLVAHFVKREERVEFYRSLTRRLKPGGVLVNTELSFDLDSSEFPAMVKNWQGVQKRMGGTPESLAMLPQQLREVLTVLPPAESERMLREAGLDLPVRFFQAFLMTGWHGVNHSS
jgi:tRNA (cmo5U34)-methyltransferase